MGTINSINNVLFCINTIEIVYLGCAGYFMQQKYLLWIFGTAAISVLFLVLLTWVGYKNKSSPTPNISEASLPPQPDNKVIQKFSIDGNIFAGNEPIRGETIYLCGWDLYPTVSSEYRKNQEVDFDAYKNGAWKDARMASIGLSGLTMKTEGGCKTSTKTDVNGHFQFTEIPQDKYFLVATTKLKGVYFAWLNTVDLNQNQQITMTR
ncbi:hypothetical protein [Altericista sp. CCNU0014]|uniref:hypothetical protein n=1 Tax=Altericista sp. CCNU0014 TaxID=3082949 RepID=UPI00384B416C